MILASLNQDVFMGEDKDLSHFRPGEFWGILQEGFRTKNGEGRSVLLAEVPIRIPRLRLGDLTLTGNDDCFFVDRTGQPTKPDRATKRFKYFIRQAGFPHAEDLRFRSLRHT
jgi:hypothetical protein